MGKVGLVLERTRTAVFADVVNDFSTYFPDGEIRSLSELNNGIVGFVDAIFKRLGYDLGLTGDQEEGSGKPKELVDLFNSIIVATRSVGQIFADTTEQLPEDLSRLRDELSANSLAQRENDFFENGDVKEWSVSSNGVNAKFGIDLSMFGDKFQYIGKLLSAIKDLAALVKKLRDYEFDKLDLPDIEAKEFAGRLIDHILVSMLKNAREVFEEDITSVLARIRDAAGPRLEDQVKELVLLKSLRHVKEYEDVLWNGLMKVPGLDWTESIFEGEWTDERIAEFRKEVNKQVDLLEAGKTDYEKAVEELKELGKDNGLEGDSIDSLLRLSVKETDSRIKETEKEIREQAGEVEGFSWNSLRDVLDKVYAVLDFLQIIRTEPTKMVDGTGKSEEAASEETTLPALDKIEDVYSFFTDAKLPQPIVDLNTIKWGCFEDLFTDPSGYFKEIFPLNSFDDAQRLVERIGKLVNAFNPSAIDFSNVKQLLFDFLEVIENKLLELKDAADDSLNEIKDALQDFYKTILEVFNTLERIAIQIKDTVVDQFEELKDKMVESLKPFTEAVKDEAWKKEFSDLFSLDGLDKIDDGKLQDVIVTPFVNAVSQELKSGDLKEVVNVKEIVGTVEGSAGELIGNYKSIFGEIESYVGSILSPDAWMDKFNGIKNGILVELRRQFANVPTSMDELGDFAERQLDSILSTRSLSGIENPFSDFDPWSFASFIGKRFYGLIPESPTVFYYKFKDATVKFFDGLSGLSLKAEPEKFKTFVENVFNSYWKGLKDAVYHNYIDPYRKMIEKAVKDWFVDLLQKAIDSVTGTMREAKNGVKELASSFNGELETVPLNEGGAGSQVDISAIVEEILLITDTAQKGIKSWEDGLQFVVNFYRLIPEKVKDAIADFIDLPEWDFSGLDLPDYQIDIQNRMLCVNVFQSKDKRYNVSLNLVAMIGKRNDKTGVYLMPTFSGSFNHGFQVTENNVISLGLTGTVNPGGSEAMKNTGTKIGFFLGKDGLTPLASDEAFELGLSVSFARGKVNGATIEPAGEMSIIDTKSVGLSIEDYPQTLFLKYSGSDGVDFGYEGTVKNLALSLKLRELNGFFEQILKDDIRVVLEKLALEFTYGKGFSIDGGLYVEIPFNSDIDLEYVKFKDLVAKVGIEEFKTFSAALSTSFTASIGGITFSFGNMGLGISTPFKDPDLDFGYKLPTSIGIGVDMTGVTGAGVINWNTDKQEYFGALELKLLDVGISAMTLMAFKYPDGSKGFNFMGALTVDFGFPGIQLGFGFALTGVGGAFGINRKINTQKLQETVRDGSLESVMFNKNLTDNLDVLVQNISTYYPAKKGQVFFGFLAHISWTEIVDVSAGLFLQAPSPTELLIAGIVKVHIGSSEELEKLFVINAAFLGGINFSKGMFFDASLFDSRIVGLELYGDMAFRLNWGGDTKGFLLSMGGFHPQFTPPAGFNVGTMKRIGVKMNYKILKFQMEQYFAITSNTVQFGIDSSLSIGWKGYGVFGDFAFNCLFQFKPFWFTTDVSFHVALKLAGTTLLSAGLDFALSGPAKWHAKGDVSFKLLFFSVEVDFETSWGKSQEEEVRETIELLQRFRDSFAEAGNWTVIVSDIVDDTVILRDMTAPDGVLVLRPQDNIQFSQNELPLDTKMEKYGENLPDVSFVRIDRVTSADPSIDIKSSEAINSSFAPSVYRNMSEWEKLTKPSYEDLGAGFSLDRKAESLSLYSALQKDFQAEDRKVGQVGKNTEDDWASFLDNLETPQTGGSGGEDQQGIINPGNVFLPKKTLFSGSLTKRVYSHADYHADTRASFRKDAAGLKRYIKVIDNAQGEAMTAFVTDAKQKDHE